MESIGGHTVKFTVKYSFVLVHHMPWTVYRRSFTGANSLDVSSDRHLQLALLARMPCVSSWKLCANQALAIPQPERERP